MAASPRVAVIGIGSAVLIALGIPLIAGVIATIQVKVRHDRQAVKERFEADLEVIREFGLRYDRFPNADDTELWSQVSDDLVGVTGEYTVMGDGFALHRLPKVVVAVLQTPGRAARRSLSVERFDGDGTLRDVLGSSGNQGVAVGLTSGEVFVVKDDMLLKDLRPLLTRNTAVQSKTRDVLSFYRLR